MMSGSAADRLGVPSPAKAGVSVRPVPGRGDLVGIMEYRGPLFFVAAEVGVPSLAAICAEVKRIRPGNRSSTSLTCLSKLSTPSVEREVACVMGVMGALDFLLPLAGVSGSWRCFATFNCSGDGFDAPRARPSMLRSVSPRCASVKNGAVCLAGVPCKTCGREPSLRLLTCDDEG